MFDALNKIESGQTLALINEYTIVNIMENLCNHNMDIHQIIGLSSLTNKVCFNYLQIKPSFLLSINYN